MKTFIELDWLPIGDFGGPTARFGCRNRLYGPFRRPILVSAQPNVANLIRKKCS